VLSDPVAISDINSLLVVFVLGSDGNLYMRRQVSGTTSTFGQWTIVSGTAPGGSNTRDPVALLSKNNRIFVYIISNGYVYEAKETVPGHGNFTEWYGIDTSKTVKGRFSVILNQWTGWIEGYAISSDNKLVQAWQLWNEKWHGFRPIWDIQPSNPSDPAAHSMTGSIFHGMIELFLVDGNGQTWHTWQTTCAIGFFHLTYPVLTSILPNSTHLGVTESRILGLNALGERITKLVPLCLCVLCISQAPTHLPTHPLFRFSLLITFMAVMKFSSLVWMVICGTCGSWRCGVPGATGRTLAIPRAVP
jgi:hypothetical protein